MQSIRILVSSNFICVVVDCLVLCLSILIKILQALQKQNVSETQYK